MATTSGGGAQIINHAYAPINAKGGDAYSIYDCGVTFGNNQYVSATISTIAAYTSQVSITAATQSGTSTIYTYTLTSGSPLITPQCFLISGMSDSGNNTNGGVCFVTNSLGSGTFTVHNPSGVTAVGQSGIGLSPSDSNSGICVRCTADGLNGYFFIAGTNSFNGDGRVYDKELWKYVGGVATNLASGGTITTIPDSPGDVYILLVYNNHLIVYKNGVAVPALTVDDNDLASGSPGIWTWSVNGAHEFDWANWNNIGVMGPATGNNGTSWTSWQAGDIPTTSFPVLSDLFTQGQTFPKQLISDSFAYADGDLHAANVNWAYVTTSTFAVSTNRVFSSHAGLNFTYRSDFPTLVNQYSQVTAVIGGTSVTQNGGPAVFIDTTTQTAYVVQYASNIFRLQIIAGGGLTLLGSNDAAAPVTGDIIRLQLLNQALTVFKNGVAVTGMTNISNSAIISGRPGLFGAGNATLNGYTTFSAGTFTGLAPNFSTTSTSQEWLSDATFGAYATNIDSFGLAYLYENSYPWPANHYSQVILSGTGLNVSGAGPGARIASSSDTGYWCQAINGNTLQLTKFINGSPTILLSKSQTYVQGDTYRIEANGPLIDCKVNGAVVLAVLDTSIASGRPGVTSGKGTLTPSVLSTMNNWQGGIFTNGSGGMQGNGLIKNSGKIQ